MSEVWVVNGRVLTQKEIFEHLMIQDPICQDIAKVTYWLIHDDIEQLRNVLEPCPQSYRQRVLTSKALKCPPIYYARTPRSMKYVLQSLDESDRLDSLCSSSSIRNNYTPGYGRLKNFHPAKFLPKWAVRSDQRFALIKTILENLNASQRLEILTPQSKQGLSSLQHISCLCLGESNGEIEPLQFQQILNFITPGERLKFLLTSRTGQYSRNSLLIEAVTATPPRHRLFHSIVNSIPKTNQSSELFSQKHTHSLGEGGNNRSQTTITTLLHLAVDHLSYDENCQTFYILEHSLGRRYDFFRLPSTDPAKNLTNRSTAPFSDTNNVSWIDTPLQCILENTTLDQMLALLRHKDSNKYTPLHYIHHGHVFLQIYKIMNLSTKSLRDILLLENGTGQTVLSFLLRLPGSPSVIGEVLPRFSFEETVIMLLKQDENNLTTFNSSLGTMESFTALMRTIPTTLEQVALLKSPVYECEGNILHKLVAELKEVNNEPTLLDNTKFTERDLMDSQLDYPKEGSWQSTKVCNILLFLNPQQRFDLLKAKDSIGRSPLHLINSPSVLILLMGMIDKNQRASLLRLKDNSGLTPFRFSRSQLHQVGNKTSKVNLHIEELIECIGVDQLVDTLRIQDNFGGTLIHDVLNKGDAAHLLRQICRPLVQHHSSQLLAIFSQKDSQGDTVLHSAVRDLRYVVYSTSDRGYRFEKAMSSLFSIIEHVGSANRASMLMDTDKDGETVMQKLSYSIEEPLIKLLKLIPSEHRSQLLKAKGKDGNTPIHTMTASLRCFCALSQVTAMTPKEERLDLFMVQNTAHCCPLHLAVISPIIVKHLFGQLPNKEACCKLLRVVDANGMTALHKSLAIDCMGSIHFMIEYCGIDILLKTLVPGLDIEVFHRLNSSGDGLHDWLMGLDALVRIDVTKIIQCSDTLIPDNQQADIALHTQQQIGEQIRELAALSTLDLRYGMYFQVKINYVLS